MTTCGRCKREIESGPAERCWYCQAWLCFACWDDVGHCGHPEAEAQNETARAAVQAEAVAKAGTP